MDGLYKLMKRLDSPTVDNLKQQIRDIQRDNANKLSRLLRDARKQ